MSSRVLIIAALLFGAPGPHNSLMAQNDPTDWHAAATKIVGQLALVRGERVLLVAVPGAADALVPLLREAVRAAGGTVDVVDLPERGVRGNSHMIMMDRNGDQVAQLVQDWLAGRGLYR